MINGSCSNQELWCDGAREQTEVLAQPMETCVTVYWMKYCYQLLQLTGNSVWADEMEVSLYNALLGALTPKGEWFAYFSPLIGGRVPSLPQHEDVGLSCCVVNGPRGLLLTPRWAVMSSREGLAVNLYAKGSYDQKLADGTEVKILQATDYPVDDAINLTIFPSKSKRFTISLRVPEWSKKTGLSVNGKEINCTPGSYAKINRTWKDGDKINLKLDLRGRVIPAPSGTPEVAVMRGPILLALDNRFVEQQDTLVSLGAELNSSIKEMPDSTEAKLAPIERTNPAGYTRIKRTILSSDPQEYVELKPVTSKPEEVWMAFEVPFQVRPSHFFNHHIKSLVMCDYSSAGNKWSENNLYRVWMPQPMYMNNMYPSNTWKLINPEAKAYPKLPKGKLQLSAVKDIE